MSKEFSTPKADIEKWVKGLGRTKRKDVSPTEMEKELSKRRWDFTGKKDKEEEKIFERKYKIGRSPIEKEKEDGARAVMRKRMKGKKKKN